MPAGKSDHLRNPVTGDVKRLKPFQANYTRPIVGFAEPDLLYALPKSADERIGRCRRIRRRANAHDVIHHVCERVWIERDYDWCMPIQLVASDCSMCPPVGNGALRSKTPILSRPRKPP